jgi:NADH-quinone oxidoreductase subunit E
MKFSEEKLAKVREIVARYPEGKQKSALIPVLHLAQEENNGWLSAEAMDHVAELLQLTPIEVYEVATFYSMYNLKQTVECLGACGYAPMMQMGKFYKEHLTREKVDQIIEECRRNAASNN